MSIQGLFLLSAFSLFSNGIDKELYTHRMLLMELKVLSLTIDVHSRNAAVNKFQANSYLNSTVKRFDALLKKLRNGDKSINLNPIPKGTKHELTAMESRWKALKKEVQVILSAEKSLAIIGKTRREINDIYAHQEATYSNIDILLNNNRDLNLHKYIYKLQVLWLKININIDEILIGGQTTVNAIDEYEIIAPQYKELIIKLIKQDKGLGLKPISKEILANVKDSHENLNKQTELLKKIFENAPLLFRAQDATSKIAIISEGLVGDLDLIDEKLLFIHNM